MAGVANFGDAPRVGERILVLREEWLERILTGQKSLEVRGTRLREGEAWLGCRSMIWGKVRLGPAMAIGTVQQWVALRPRHLIQTDALPYKRTYACIVLGVCKDWKP